MKPRRTRIVATLGPATDRPGVLKELLDLGLDVARLNLSHGDRNDHLARVARLRELTDRRARPVALLADLPGPKLRVRLARPVVLARHPVQGGGRMPTVRVVRVGDGGASVEP